MIMEPRKQIHNINVSECCSRCDYGTVDDIYVGEYRCLKVCDEILHPEPNGTVTCPYYKGDEI